MYQILAIFFVHREVDSAQLATMMPAASSKSRAIAQTRWRPWILGIIFLGMVGYVLCRLALLAPFPSEANAFGHDSAYIAIVAQNLRDGKGYVNDAHWLVSVHPDRLPVPFHNANPLYPTVVAGVSHLTQGDVVRAGFVVSIVAHALLFPVLLWLLGRFVAVIQTRILLALAGCAFPTIFSDAGAMLPDALCTLLTFTSLACFVRLESVRGMVLGGVLFGLAWLTRSSVVLVLPGVGLLFLLWYPSRAAVLRFGVVLLTALVVVSPWLIRNYRVWKSPTRSDSSLYLLQDYHTRDSNESLSVAQDKYYHSPEVPPSLGEVLDKEQTVFSKFLLSNATRYVRNVLGGWASGSWIVGMAIGVLFLAGAFLLVFRVREGDSPKWSQASRLMFVALCTADLILLAFLPRALSMEIRYLSFVSICLAFVLLGGLILTRKQWSEFNRLGRYVFGVLFVVNLAFWLVYVPYRNVEHLIVGRRINQHLEQYYDEARLVAKYNTDNAPVVVGTHPYFFTWASKQPSLSIPTSDDAYLDTYMKKYGANYVYLTQDELNLWKPEWKKPEARPDYLHLVESEVPGYLFERTTE